MYPSGNGFGGSCRCRNSSQKKQQDNDHDNDNDNDKNIICPTVSGRTLMNQGMKTAVAF
jgi:hypothetical protein